MKLKAGVLGAGHLGKIHLKLLQQSEKYELVGFYDPDASNGQKVESEFGYTFFNSLEALIDAVDVVDIVTPTLSHLHVPSKPSPKANIFLLKNQSPILLKKPNKFVCWFLKTTSEVRLDM